MIYIIRDEFYTEDFFDDIKLIMKKYWPDVIKCKINGIIFYTDRIEIGLVRSHKVKVGDITNEWFHSILGDDKYHTELRSYIKGYMRDIKLSVMCI